MPPFRIPRSPLAPVIGDFGSNFFNLDPFQTRGQERSPLRRAFSWRIGVPRPATLEGIAVRRLEIRRACLEAVVRLQQE
jgi:hypothetical protein